ncbi:TPA: hypothetical protein ACT9MX_003047 [Legionella pneumophila]
MNIWKTTRDKLNHYFSKNKPSISFVPPGLIEPHTHLLNPLPNNRCLYKITNIDYLLNSILGNYLYFNNVSSYSDFQLADINDGAQLPLERPINASSSFETDPKFTMEHYYDNSRSRTYASCFSIQNSEHIWENYGNHNSTAKVGIIFDYTKLKTMLNAVMLSSNTRLLTNNIPCIQFFSINYGMIKYVNWQEAKNESEFLRNPIEYAYIKDLAFQEENEFRITLSALGLGNFTLNNGEVLNFTQRPSLHLYFNYLAAAANGTIIGIQYSYNGKIENFQNLISDFRIFPT